MKLPARNTLAIVGAGPIGLEAALAALDHGLDVHVFERGEVGSHPIAWGHVRLFTPWRMNIGPVSRKHLEAAGWKAPDPESFPTGRELAEQLLQPIAALPELKDRIHTHAQVAHISRRGAIKSDLIGKRERGDRPFRMLVRDAGGRENFIHAFSVIDASGVYGKPNWAGDGGIPARNELYLAPQLSYHVDDVLDLRRARYAGKRTMVIGSGASAATVVAQLVQLAGEAEGTRVAWVTRRPAGEIYPEDANDPLPERRALYAQARKLIGGESQAVDHIGGARLDELQFNSATHRYHVTLMLGEQQRVEEVDQIIVTTGFGPDNSIYRELQVHECWATRGPMKLAAAILGSGAADCLDTPAFGLDVLANPEPRFFILGNKSYGRNNNFLLETGYQQVGEVLAALAAELQSANA